MTQEEYLNLPGMALPAVLKEWAKTPAIICARVGDPFWSEIGNSIKVKCYNCECETMVSEETRSSPYYPIGTVICIQCGTMYAAQGDVEMAPWYQPTVPNKS